MRIPDIDKRTKSDVIRKIRALSASYTPEWRFDEEYPDVGTALALIWAELFEGTIKRYNMVAEKNMLAFFNSINARLLPAIPASGYVKFGLGGKLREGIPVRKGTQLISEAPEEPSGNIIFETCNDVLVTPAELQEIFYVNGGKDFISRAWDRADENRSEEFALFNPYGENLQRHALYLSFTDALQIRSGAWITLELWPYRQNHFRPHLLEALMDPEVAVWEYYASTGSEAKGEDWVRFENEKLQDGRFVFFKAESQPAFGEIELFGHRGQWLRCNVPNAQALRDLTVERLALTSRGIGIIPDVVNAVGIEQPLNGCFAFGEKMAVYSDVYFGSAEALGKRGALVKLQFNLDFLRIPIDMDVTDPAIDWKLIMKKSDFKLDQEYDITIEEVLWEYYNGRGWARLFPDHEYSDTFSTAHGTTGQHRTVTFRCPADMKPFLLDAWESCFIRARVLKVSNAFKTRGHYISPYIAEITFDYDYSGNPAQPAYLCACNNMEEQEITPAALNMPDFGFAPFRPRSGDRPEIYLGFDTAPLDGPIKILFSLKGTMRERPARLVWEYYSRRGWRTVNVVDESESMRKTGIVTLMGNRDFAPLTLWGVHRYWLRIADVSGSYSCSPLPELPVVTGIHMNATQALNMETRAAELFTMDGHTEHFCCPLIYGRLCGIDVWVNEFGDIDSHTLSDLERVGMVEPVYDKKGQLTEAWVKWHEVEDFTTSLPDARVYIADRNDGAVTFPDGVHGMLPPSRNLNNIRIAYATTNGEAGNLEAGRLVRTNRYIGFVNQVTNPEITSGGCDQETIPQAVARSAASLKHRYRGVTATDYEWLAAEATRNILKARCFGNHDDHGAYKPGCVTLVILQKDYIRGRNFFSALQEQVYTYIAERISGNIAGLGRFFVIEPQFLELCVTAELTVGDFNRVFDVREQVQTRLRQFIDPVSGNFDGGGWQIGTIPNRTQILNCLKDVPDVLFIKNVLVAAYTYESHGKIEADPERRGEWIYALPLNGDHEIEIKVE